MSIPQYSTNNPTNSRFIFVVPEPYQILFGNGRQVALKVQCVKYKRDRHARNSLINPRNAVSRWWNNGESLQKYLLAGRSYLAGMSYLAGHQHGINILVEGYIVENTL